MITTSRRTAGLGFLSALLVACTARSASPTLDAATAEGPVPPPTPRKLRILCLHGYHGSARALRAQMAGFTEGLESLAEFVCSDAPSLAQGDFGWWHAVVDESDTAREDPGVLGPHRHYKGWERTREAIVRAFETQGPFDGIFGFSQGAALAGLLVGLRAPDARATPERPLCFDFAMMVSGFPSNDPQLAALYARTDSYALPSFHLVGRSDGVVPIEDSRRLASLFGKATVVEHAGGHVVASDRAVRERARTFLEERLRAKGAPEGESRPMSTEPIVVTLWPGRDAPTMRVVFPAGRAQGAASPALVIFRGGGYATSRGSGGGAADWAAANGMVGVEVDYRTRGTGDSYPAGYADAARAVRLVRAHAAAWGVDVARVGVLGFSAGGHLASLLSTQPTLHLDPADDLAPRTSARPDFVILGYPVISFVEGYRAGAYAGSSDNFFGRRVDDLAERRRFSNELHVAEGHPPVFVWTTADDDLVSASHSRLFAEACERARVPVSFVEFPHGPHGLGLAERDPEVGVWPRQALAWLQARGILSPRGER